MSNESQPKPEIKNGITKEEAVPAPVLERAVDTLTRSFDSFSYEAPVGTKPEKRLEVWNEFVAKNLTPAFEKFVSENPSPNNAEKENLQTLFKIHQTIPWILEAEREKRERERISAFPAPDRRAASKKLRDEAMLRNEQSAAWQQKMAWFILQNKNKEHLSPTLLRLWNATAKAGEYVTENPQDIYKQERGIERVVTAIEALEEAGIACTPTSAKKDVHYGVDIEGTSTKQTTGVFPEFFIQVKPLRREDEQTVQAEVLYPFPPQSEVSERIWNLIEYTKKIKAEAPEKKLFPLLVRVPSTDQNPLLERGTGLKKRACRGASSGRLLDADAEKQLEATSNTSAPFKPKKRTVYIPKQ